ncbi:MAG: methyltransferase domain-containing protein, partial [Actinomycetota bacterium]|nr:methyltransferase domain-containing protein [Actinomycetota bacterium]
WHQASAEDMPLPDASFDVVLCQIGLQFVPDKLAALREMRRVLAPGGRLVLNAPGPTPPPFVVLADTLARHVTPEVARFVHVVFSLHDPGELGDLLAAAGFADVVTERHPKTLHLPPPVEFLWQYVRATPLAGPLAQVDDVTRTAIEREVVAGWQPFTEDGGMTVEVDVLTATIHAVQGPRQAAIRRTRHRGR